MEQINENVEQEVVSRIKEKVNELKKELGYNELEEQPCATLFGLGGLEEQYFLVSGEHAILCKFLLDELEEKPFEKILMTQIAIGKHYGIYGSDK